MALVFCPECGTKISDKAFSCPFCGFRSSKKNLPMIANKSPVQRIKWDNESLLLSFDQVFPISAVQSNNLNLIFSKAENLSRVAPALFETIQGMVPKTVKIADTNPLIQKLINDGTYRFITDQSGEILPTIFGEKGIVAQVRLRDVLITLELSSSIIDLQTQIALAQVLSEIRGVQRSLACLHRELQNDRLALADSAWQQLQQAVQISDGRVREEKYLSVLSSATDAKCTLFKAFSSDKQFLDKRKDNKWFQKIVDREIQNKGDVKSAEIFTCLLAITKAVQTEITAYCLLGEKNAARTSMNQFSGFISENKLDDRDELLYLNSFSSSDQISLIDYFTDLRQKIASLPSDFEDIQPLSEVLPAKKED